MLRVLTCLREVHTIQNTYLCAHALFGHGFALACCPYGTGFYILYFLLLFWLVSKNWNSNLKLQKLFPNTHRTAFGQGAMCSDFSKQLGLGDLTLQSSPCSYCLPYHQNSLLISTTSLSSPFSAWISGEAEESGKRGRLLFTLSQSPWYTSKVPAWALHRDAEWVDPLTFSFQIDAPFVVILYSLLSLRIKCRVSGLKGIKYQNWPINGNGFFSVWSVQSVYHQFYLSL